ncbi:MAG: sulfotransferase domain-containing protein [Pseudomonadota bacterium]|nr:sulfotransferase domain-containing protein [Pseudomonadota bacterium]
MNKNIIMCITTGRSGTNLLQALLGLSEDTCAVHEPEPSFTHRAVAARQDLSEAIDFVENTKLPDIMSRPEHNYVETSHLFGKGFFEAFRELKIPFRLIILNRNPRDVAYSLWRLDTIPYRTDYGRRFLLSPDEKGVLKLAAWRRMSDYQLCYWYCLEMERRKSAYAAICKNDDVPVAEISMERLKKWDDFQEMCQICGLTVPASAQKDYAQLTSRKINAKADRDPKKPRIPLSI